MRSTPPDPRNPGDKAGPGPDTRAGFMTGSTPGSIGERFAPGADFSVLLIDPDPDHDWLPGLGLIRRVSAPLAEAGTPADDTIEIHRDPGGREALVLTIPGQHDPLALGQRIAAQLPEAQLGVAASSGGKDLPHGTVLAVAAEGLDVARGGGTTRVIHSELYDLVARSLARRAKAESPTPSPTRAIDPLAPELLARGAQVAEPMREADDPFAHESPIPDESHGAAGSTFASTADSTAGPVSPSASVGGASEPSGETQADRQTLAAAELARSRDERRIQKLKDALEHAERENDRLRALVEGDTGLASQHREVQGLVEFDPKRREKQQLIDGLFAQNARRKNDGDASPP